MDALALLCTLHADGPATLKRLRQVGCSTLEQIDSIEVARLAELLGASPAAARRFVREARSLSERVGGGWLERDDSSARPLASPARESHGVPVAPAEPGDDTALSLGDSALVERVLSVWRERDQVDSPAATATTSARASIDRASIADRASAPIVSTAPLARAAASKPSVPLHALTPGVIDGLDAALCARLAEQGVDTLDALAEADALTLAKALDLGYTRVHRLQFQSARAIAQRPVADARSQPATEKLSPSETPAQDFSLRIDFEPLLEMPRSVLPAVERNVPNRAAGVDRAASLHAAASPHEDAGGPFA
jgi:predicted flap endonuclease-1-like 5' DNA nuclease